MHSLMLLESPGKTIRCFIAEGGAHRLWQNDPSEWGGCHPLSVAFHPHHCNLTLSVTSGTITNWVVRSGNDLTVGLFEYKSALLGEKRGFTRITPNEKQLSTDRVEVLPEGSSTHMLASEFHTVAVNGDAAWLVLEGVEDKQYHPYCYSNEDLETADMRGLYTQTTEADCVKLLRQANLL
jgi:hypothetical protein